ncbi:hypothetical protein DPMN_174828 [Dreissena polymorpha]|uniref:Uncharacterized protein n=1 Tax=Dreissena polymorpha TaxID=45954 RepID=A0A9D4IFH2_DREPO|nr:hypothetical protein DPMN_174828 [Dreissena polymorpha]
MAGPKGGLRSGPAANKDWARAFKFLEVRVKWWGVGGLDVLDYWTEPNRGLHSSLVAKILSLVVRVKEDVGDYVCLDKLLAEGRSV